MASRSPVSPLTNLRSARPVQPESTKEYELQGRYSRANSDSHRPGKAGLKIQMSEMKPPTSPENVYHHRQYAEDESRRPTLIRQGSTPSSSFSHKKTDSMTERLIARRSTKAAQWRIHWRAPVSISVAFTTGVLLAIGQHLLYSELHKSPIIDEGSKNKQVLYGRALAYFSKIAFGGCLTMIYRQRLWTTFRQEALSIWSIDQLFFGTEDPTLFFNWETISRALLPTLIALVIWLIPLATIIFSPGALSFGESLNIFTSTHMVPTLNFELEAANWRDPPKMINSSTVKRSLMFYNTTDIEGKKDGYFDYYDQPSTELTRISVLNAWSLQDHSLMRADARTVSCNGTYDCKYTTNFIAPQYRCEELATGPQDNKKLAELGAPFNTNDLVPYGRNVYLADVGRGEYERPQSKDIGAGGVPTGRTPEDLGVFKMEPHLWIGYSTNSSEPWPANSPFAKNWTSRLDPHIFRCIHYEANYTVSWNYTESSYNTSVSFELLYPILDTNYSKLENGDLDLKTIRPTSNFIRPQDERRYKRTAAFHALGQSMRDFLNGNIELEPEFPGQSFARVNSKITQTRMVSNITNTPHKDLPSHLQSFYSDTVISLFSSPQMLVVNETMASVEHFNLRSTFIYDPFKLWICYLPVIMVTLLILLLYIYTVWCDGTTWSVGFSRILVTTRNQTLDEISRGACLGNDPFPSELLRTKLQFGVLNDSSDLEILGLDGVSEIGHCSFGVPSELSPIIRGAPYAGLKQRAESSVGARRRIIEREKQKVD